MQLFGIVPEERFSMLRSAAWRIAHQKPMTGKTCLLVANNMISIFLEKLDRDKQQTNNYRTRDHVRYHCFWF